MTEIDNVEDLKELMKDQPEARGVNWHEINQEDIYELNDDLADAHMQTINEFLYRFSR